MAITIHDAGQSRFRTLAALAVPAILEQLLGTLVSYVDTAMVGGLGSYATAAVGVNAPVVWLVNGVFPAVGVGYAVLVAHAIGAGKEEQARHTISQSLLAVLVCGFTLFALLLSLSGFIPRWLGAEPEVLPHAISYLRIYAFSLPFAASLAVLASIVRCMGNAKLPLILNTAANLLNVILNFFLINPTREIRGVTVWGANLGVAGAAIATALSMVLSGSLMLLSLFLRKDSFRLTLKEDWTPDTQLIRRAARLSLPNMVERFAINFGQITTTWIIGTLGTVPMAANHIAVTAEGLCYLPAYGIAFATTALVGQSVGGGDLEGAKKYGSLSGICAFALCAVTGLALFLFAPQLASIFNKDPAVVAEAVTVLRIIAPIESFFAVFIVLAGALRGAGDTKFPMLLCLFSMWGVRIVLSPILVFVFHVGLSGVWIAMGADLVVRGVGCILRWRRDRWMRPYKCKEPFHG